MNYKYLITIDGDSASLGRHSLILLSNSVPLVVETNFKPLYQSDWIPFVHYVPVKNDLSDLIQKIEWLRINDK